MSEHAISPTITFGHESDEDFVLTWLAQRTLSRRLAFMRAATWQTAGRIDALPAEALECAAVTPTRQLALLDVRGLAVLVDIGLQDACSVQMYAERYSEGDFEAVLAQLKGWLEPKVERDPGRVQFGFRYNASRYPRYYRRGMAAPAWTEIRENYAAGTQADIDALMQMRAAPPSGRLLLLHGPPGTGKTYVIRSLAREWREWCGIEYIADPDAFFADAEYMMHVLIAGGQDVEDEADDDKDDNEPARRPRWRLLVLEDAGDLLVRDAKQGHGGLGRLLNLGEGLIGQGLRVMTMISTNERLDALNEAVSRPGRTALEAEFLPLSAAECAAWLQRRGITGPALPEGATLAELFEVEAGKPATRLSPRRPLGFARRS